MLSFRENHRFSIVEIIDILMSMKNVAAMMHY